jgi:hypothetical protein
MSNDSAPRDVLAGQAFQERVDNDPEMRAAWERIQTRMQAFVNAMIEGINSSGYREAVEAQRRVIQEGIEAIQAGLEAARDTLETRHLGRPKGLQEWMHLARVVEMPEERLRAKDYTLREVYEYALAWADRQTAKAKLTDEATRVSLGAKSSRAKKVPKPAKRDKKTEARDKWIYQRCCAGVPHDKIVADLKKIGPKRGWRIFSTKNRVWQIGKEYAERSNLPLPPARQGL